MSNRVEGQVYKVYDKNIGGRTFYSIKLEDNPIYYRCNEKRWAGIAEAGNRVAFNATLNTDGRSAKVDGDVVLAAPPAPVATQGQAPSYGGDRNTSIVYQSSRKDAIELVRLLVGVNAIKMPKVQSKVAGVVEAAVDYYTAMFYEDVNTLGAVLREAEKDDAPAETDEGEEEGEE